MVKDRCVIGITSEETQIAHLALHYGEVEKNS